MAETLESLRRGLDAADELLSVVKTMKGLAAVNIRQYDEAVRSLRDYSRTIELGFQVLLRNRPEVLAAAEQPDGRLAVVVIGSDQGMCGPLNGRMAEHAVETLAGSGADPAKPLILVAGGRLAAELDAAGQPVDAAMALPGSVAEITDAVQRIVGRVERWREQQGAQRVWVLHHRPVSAVSYRAETIRLLPIDAAWLGELAARAWPTRMLPALTMDAGALLSSLVRQHVFTVLYRALAESLAAENAARLAAMQAAEKNIEERLDGLGARYHRHRQSVITEELLDVVAGFEVLKQQKR